MIRKPRTVRNSLAEFLFFPAVFRIHFQFYRLIKIGKLKLMISIEFVHWPSPKCKVFPRKCCFSYTYIISDGNHKVSIFNSFRRGVVLNGHSLNKSSLLTTSSLFRLRKILLIQYWLLLPFCNFGFNTSQSLPWKNSPSQKLQSNILLIQYQMCQATLSNPCDIEKLVFIMLFAILFQFLYPKI